MKIKNFKQKRALLSIIVVILFIFNSILPVFAFGPEGAFSGSGELKGIVYIPTATGDKGSQAVSGMVLISPKNELSSGINYNEARRWGVNADGSFTASNLSNGEFFVVAYPGMDSPFSSSFAKIIKVADGKVSYENGSGLELVYSNPQIQVSTKDSIGNSVIKDFNINLFKKTNSTSDYTFYANMDLRPEGGCTIGGLEPGEYRLEAPSAKYADPDPVNITIGTDYTSSLSIIDFTFNNPMLLGSVNNPDGTALEYGHVEAINKSTGQGYGSGAQNGIFSIDSLQDGTYSLAAYPNGDGNYTKSFDMEIIIEGGKLISPTSGNIQLTLTEAQIVGQVTNLSVGQQYNGSVQIRSELGKNSVSADIKSDGKFYVGGLSDGNYKLIAQPYKNAERSNSNELLITIAGGKCTASPVTLAFTNPFLSGTVLNPDKSPAGFGNVEIRRENGDFVTNYSYRNGMFVIGNLQDGAYIISAYPDFNTNSCKSINRKITIKAGAVDESDKNMVLSLTIPQIIGQVTNLTSGQAGWVNIWPKLGGSGSTAQIKSDGKFYIGGLENGDYILRAQPNGGDDSLAPSKELIITISNNEYSGSPVSLTFSKPQIIGSIQDPNGNPINFAGLEILKDNNGVNASTSGYNDKFVISNLEDGVYYIAAMPEGNSIYGRSDSRKITIKGGIVDPITDKNIIFTLSSSQVSGQVSNLPSSSTFGRMGRVEASQNFSGGRGYGTNIQLDGKFYLGGLQPGEYTLRAYANWGDITRTVSDKITITIGADGKYNGSSIPLVLNNPQLICKVNAPNLPNVSQGFVQVQKNISGDNWQYIDNGSMQVNSQGMVAIGGLEQGTYKLKAIPSDSSSTYCASIEKIIVIDANGKYFGTGGTLDTPIVLSLTTPMASGKVTGPKGENIGYGNIEVRDILGMKFITNTNINRDGSFRLESLADGQYKLKAYPGYGIIFANSLDTNITVSGGNIIVPEGELILRLTSPQVSGTVVDSVGNLQPYGYISIKTMDGSYMQGSGVDNVGKFLIAGLTAGDYYLSAEPNSNSLYCSSVDTKITIDNDGNCVQGDIKLTLTEPKLTGKVMAGTNLAKYTNVEVRQGGRGIKSVQTDMNGVFKIGTLNKGTYILVAYPDWIDTNYAKSMEKEIEIDINGNLVGSSNLVLNLSTPQVKGIVTGSNGEIVKYGYINVRDKDSGEYIEGSGLNEFGQFRLSNLVVGKTYILKAYPTNGIMLSASKEVEITIGNSLIETTLRLTTPQVEGVITGPNSETVAKGYVEIREKDSGMWVGNFECSDSGRFYLGNLVIGTTYIIKAYPTRGMNFSTSKDTEFIFTGEKMDILVHLTTPQIYGKVTGPSGELASGGSMEIREKATGIWKGWSDIDNNGNFRIGGLPDDDTVYEIKANYWGVGDFTSSKWVECDLLTAKSGSIAVKLNVIQLSGKVKAGDVDSHDGWVEVQKLDSNSNWSWVYGIGLDSTGTYKIGGLDNGQYRVKAYPNNNSQFTASDYSEFTITNGVITSVVPNLELNTPQLTGNVKDSIGNLSSSSWIEIQSQVDTGWQWFSGVGTDVNGKFAIGGLKNGVYRIRAYPNWKSKTDSPSDYAEIRIIDGKIDGTSSLTLNLANVQAQGLVTNYNNNTWVEIGEKLLDGTVAYVKSIPVYSDGGFRVSGLDTTKNYVIQAFATDDNGGSKAQSDVVDLDLSNTNYIQLTTHAQIITNAIKSMITNASNIFVTATTSTVIPLGISPVKPEPGFVNTKASSSTSIEGKEQTITVDVNTVQIKDNTAVTAQLMDDSGTSPIEGVAIGSTIINGNKATLTLTLPASVSAGSYTIKLSIASLQVIDISTKYSITKPVSEVKEESSTVQKEDVNLDNNIDSADLKKAADNFGTKLKDEKFDGHNDVNRDGLVDIFDLVQVSKKMVP